MPEIFACVKMGDDGQPSRKTEQPFVACHVFSSSTAVDVQEHSSPFVGDPRTKHLYVTPCSPYRNFAKVLPCRQELYDAVASGDLESLRNYRAYWNIPICTYRQPGYGEIFTTPQLCLLLQQERLLNYLLADPFTDVEARSSPSGWTLLMIACAADASLGVVSLILQRANSKLHINAISASGNTALDCAPTGGNVYLFLLDHGALLAEEIRGASASGGAVRDHDGKMDERVTDPWDLASKVPKGLSGNEHVENKTQEQSKSAGQVCRGVVSHQQRTSSLATVPQRLVSSTCSKVQVELAKTHPRASMSLPEVLCRREEVLKKSQPARPPKRNVYRGSKPNDSRHRNARPLATERAQTDNGIQDKSNVRHGAAKVPSGTSFKPPAGRRQDASMASLTGTLAFKGAVKPVASGISQRDGGKWEDSEGSGFSAVKSLPTTFSKPAGSLRQANSISQSERPLAAKSTGRVHSALEKDFPSKDSLSERSAQTEDIAHSGYAVTPPAHECSIEEMKNTPLASVSVGTYDRTGTKPEAESTLAKRFHTLASVDVSRRVRKSAFDVPAIHHEHLQRTDSQGSSGRTSAEVDGPLTPDGISRPGGLLAQTRAQSGQLATTEAAAEGNAIAGPIQRTVQDEQVRDVTDGRGKFPELDKCGGGKNVTAEAAIPDADRKLWRGESTTSLRSPTKANSSSKQLPALPSHKKFGLRGVGMTAQKSGVSVKPRNKQELFSPNVTPELTEASFSASETPSLPKDDSLGTQSKAVSLHADPETPDTSNSRTPARSSRHST